MLFILAPSKTMDFGLVDMKGHRPTSPYFQEDAEHIVKIIRHTDDLASLMKMSPALAEATRKTYEMWGRQTKPLL